jgi:hypothetical protein
MEIAVRYRQYAAQCVRAAQQVADRSIRNSLLDMAQVWIALADQAERSSRTAESASALLLSEPARNACHRPS